MMLTLSASWAGEVRESSPGEMPGSPQAPSAPAQAFVVATRQSIDDILRGFQSENKTQNLMAGDAIGYRVFLQHEKDVSTNQAEVHDGADDMFVVLEGTATLILGGRLESPQQIQPGEWRSPGIAGGKEFKMAKGDLAIVPRGTPHMRVTTGEDVSILIIKAFAPAKR